MKTDRWIVYLLRCSDDSLYCGITNDLITRVETHRTGKGSKYVRSRLPCSLKAFAYVIGRSEALKLEAFIKKLPRSKKVEYILGRGGVECEKFICEG